MTCIRDGFIHSVELFLINGYRGGGVSPGGGFHGSGTSSSEMTH